MFADLPIATNQQFCYWLQGYFEISNQPVTLHQKHIEIIISNLAKINEQLGDFTSWLKQVCDYCELQNYKSETLMFFTPIIQDTLNHTFMHVIDNSYENTISSAAERQMIHDGEYK